MVRARNEENIIRESLESLKGLTIPYEIIVVLHLCTDSTEEIVKSIDNPNIQIFHYNEEVSRAGYECFVTEPESKHSIMTYYNFCKNKTSYPWIFKWDADMVAKPELIDFINSKTWEKKNINYIIGWENSTTSAYEPYLMGSLMSYGKHYFWEVPIFYEIEEQITLGPWIKHVSEFDNMKSYWKNKPWYETEDSDEARIVKERIQILNDKIGPEIQGMARANCKDCDYFYLKVKELEHELFK